MELFACYEKETENSHDLKERLGPDRPMKGKVHLLLWAFTMKCTARTAMSIRISTSLIWMPVSLRPALNSSRVMSPLWSLSNWKNRSFNLMRLSWMNWTRISIPDGSGCNEWTRNRKEFSRVLGPLFCEASYLFPMLDHGITSRWLEFCIGPSFHSEHAGMKIRDTFDESLQETSQALPKEFFFSL